jgi:hypothetical protein
MLQPSLPPQSDHPDVSDNPAGALGGRGDSEQRETDILETISSTNPSIPDAPAPSADSAQDSGLAEPVLDDAGNVVGEDDNLDEDGNGREIPMTDWEGAPHDDVITSPEMADMNAPGEVDIEALDEDAANDALPPDARLDPLED